MALGEASLLFEVNEGYLRAKKEEKGKK